MSTSRELLVYASQLRREDYPEGWGGTPELEAAVRQAVEDRLSLARELLRATERVNASAEEDGDYRIVISRAYYVCHHAIRACILHHDRGDVEGHTEAISIWGRLVQAEPMLRSRLAHVDMNAMKHRREIADYYPYGATFPREQPLDLRQAAHEVLAEARDQLRAVTDFIRGREGEDS